MLWHLAERVKHPEDKNAGAHATFVSEQVGPFIACSHWQGHLLLIIYLGHDT